jgi:prophage antirepressor-like protein
MGTVEAERTIEVEYKGKKINVTTTNENPSSGKDIKISGALIPALELEGGTIETQTDENGVVWFKAKDVCAALEYDTANLDNTMERHVDKADRMRRTTSSSGQRRKVNFINESGLYSLILSSQLPKAKEFKNWVTSEVLPKIARTGRYESKEQTPFVRQKGDELAGIQKLLMEVYKKECERNSVAPDYMRVNMEVNKGSLGVHENGIRQRMTEHGSRRLNDGMVGTGIQMLQGNLRVSTYKEKIEEKIGVADPSKTVVAPKAVPKIKHSKKTKRKALGATSSED